MGRTCCHLRIKQSNYPSCSGMRMVLWYHAYFLLTRFWVRILEVTFIFPLKNSPQCVWNSKIKSSGYRWELNSGLFSQSLLTYQSTTSISSLRHEPLLSVSSFSLPLPYPLSLFLSSSSSSLCHSCWWKDRDSTGHSRWKPLLPEWLSICFERQSGSNMHICLHIWNVLSLLYAMVLKFFWWGMMRASPLFTAISWKKKTFFIFFSLTPLFQPPLREQNTHFVLSSSFQQILRVKNWKNPLVYRPESSLLALCAPATNSRIVWNHKFCDKSQFYGKVKFLTCCLTADIYIYLNCSL